MEYIGRFEYIEEDFKEVCKLLKFKNVDLLFKNKTNHRECPTCQGHLYAIYIGGIKLKLENKYYCKI